MLLEYTIDSNEDEIFPSSIELRSRIAARRAQAAVDAGVISDKGILAIRDKNKKELHKHGEEILSITLAEVNSKVTLVRIDQQLKIESKLRALDKDISRATRLGKTRLDSLDDLEQRILRMRQELHAPGVSSVLEDLDHEKKIDNTARHERMFSECPICKRRILAQLMKNHKDACQKLGGRTNNLEPIFDFEQDITTSLTTSNPQPPRDCKVIRVGSSFIEFGWEAPVIDGGLKVYDYEVKFRAHRIEYDAKAARMGGAKYKRWVEEMGPFSTSLWSMRTIVCHKGAKIGGLLAAIEYSDFMVRCRNLRGFSDWVSIGRDSVKTNEPEPPSRPLFFELENTTSSCIHLKWNAPMYSGGDEITNYVISYTVIERHISAASRNIMIPVDHKVNTESKETAFVLRNILSEVDVVNISIRAENKAGLLSEPNPDLFFGNTPENYAKIEVVRTLPSSRHKQLMDQLKLAKDTNDDFIDTDFIGGVQQRLGKVLYINFILLELQKVEPHWLEEEEALIWGKIKVAQKQKAEMEAKWLEEARKKEDDEAFSDDDDEEDNARRFIFPYRVRRAHFRHKISKLEATIISLKQEKHIIDASRSRLTNLMKREQKRKLELQLEKDRVNTFKGDMVTSSALHGSAMRYHIDEFRVKIQMEYERSLALIADSKLSVINGENRKSKLKGELLAAEELLKDRQASFKNFNMEHEKAIKAMEKMQASDLSIYKFFFDRLIQNRDSRRKSKDTVQNLFDRVRTNALRQAFLKWRTGEHEQGSNNKSAFLSVGSVLLQKAKETRLEIQGLARAAIAEIPKMMQSIDMVYLAKDQRKRLTSSVVYKDMEEGLDHIVLERKALHYLYEADSLTYINKFEEAKTLYEIQIWALRASIPVDVKLLAISYGRLGRLFLRQERFDRAIVEFDRQLSLAKEIDDKVEAADAYYGIGSGFLGRCHYDDAIRYLDIAQSLLKSIGSAAKYCGALRGLRECYQRINKMNVVKVFDERIEVEENELKSKIAKISRAYADMQERLVQNAADIEHLVQLERLSKRALDLRQRIDVLHETEKERKHDLTFTEEKIAMQLELIRGIHQEMDEAFATEEPEMHSNYGNDMPQVIEIEELRRRLPIRLREEKDRLDELKVVQHDLETKVKNMIDTLTIEEDNLSVEQGELAKKARDDKPFRCVAFNPANAASNEVTGTNTGGVENFVAAEGHNIHMLDYHNGELLHIFNGSDKRSLGEKSGHTGVVTCLFYDGLAGMIFSGSADQTIISWNSLEKVKLLTMIGHEGSISCITVEGDFLVSGSADNTVRIWNKLSGLQLRVLHGHSRSVLCIDYGITWLVTGSVDEEIRVWSITQKTKHSLNVVTRLRLVGHECPITALKYGKLEIVSGDNLGRVFIWWTETGEILRQCYVHHGPIRSLQFDSIHIVTGGTDKSVCITDIATGEVIQTLRGHEGHVLSIAFDYERIISVSCDNTLRYWQWGKKTTVEDKVHVLNVGETLVVVSKRYDIPMDQLMRWNGIKSLKACYPGMKLIVQKGDLSQPTEAEALEIEKERRRKEMLSIAEKNLKKAKLSTGVISIKPYDRVYRLAMDLDPHSLGNRMYADEKKKRDVFLDSVDINKDNKSLASRLHKEEAVHSDALSTRFFISKGNEDEWGAVSDLLGASMIDMLVEFEAYALVKEMKSKLRDSTSVIGRIHKYEADGFPEESLEWFHKQEGKHLPLKLRKHIDMVTGEEKRKKEEAEAMQTRERMMQFSRERQGAGLPLEPVLNTIRKKTDKTDGFLPIIATSNKTKVNDDATPTMPSGGGRAIIGSREDNK